MDKVATILTAKDIQAMGFSRPMAYRFLNRRDMPVITIGRRKYLHREMFLTWLHEQASKNEKCV